MTTSPGPQKKRALWKHPLVRIGGSAAMLALLFTALPFAEIAKGFREMPVHMWPLALAMYMTLHLVGVVKWRLLVNTAGAGLTFRTAVRAYYMGLFGNTFLPSIVGGDVVRAGVALRAARSKSGLVLGSLIDRLLDILGLAAVAGIGALLSPRALEPQSRRIFLTLGAVLALAGVGAVIALLIIPVRRFPWKVRRMLVQVRRAMRATMQRPQALVGAFLLGMLLQTLLTVLNWWLGLAIGIDIPLYVWLFVWPLAKVAGLLPLTQNGIGVREAAQAVLFAPFGVSAAKAVSTGLVFEVVIISGGLLGGLIAYLLSAGHGERSALRASAHAPPDPAASGGHSA
ncbi:MAG: lysylphosphatidylglycerol synthase transmembrane domain-containing protein [Gemmatimonadaceae bacterium]